MIRLVYHKDSIKQLQKHLHRHALSRLVTTYSLKLKKYLLGSEAILIKARLASLLSIGVAERLVASP